MKIVKVMVAVLTHLVALMIYFWTFIYYITITNEIPSSYTVSDWNLHLLNLTISALAAIVQLFVIPLWFRRGRSKA